MEKTNFKDVLFEDISINDICGLFTDARIDKTTVPDGGVVYEIRGRDNEFEMVENNVLVDFNGSFLTLEKIEIPDSGFTPIVDYCFGDGEITFEKWIKAMREE